MAKLEGRIKHHFNAGVLTPMFLDMVNHPEIDKDIDGYEVPPELIAKHDLRIDGPYTMYQDFCGVKPGEEDNPHYYLKRNPIRFAKDAMQFKFWPVGSFVRLLRKIPFEIYMNNRKYPGDSELAVETLSGPNMRICPYNKEDIITHVNPLYYGDLEFQCMTDDGVDLSYDLLKHMPEYSHWTYLPEESEFLSAKNSIHLNIPYLKKVVKGDSGNLSMQVSIRRKHDPTMISREKVGIVIREEDIHNQLKRFGGWVEKEDGTKIIL